MPSLISPRTREEGFTLIELLVVIIIIGILAAIAIPLFLDQRKLAVDASVKADVRNTLNNVQTWQAADEANRTKAEASSSSYTTDGGKLAVSPGNTVGVSIDATGAATICGFSTGGNGKTYTATGTAYVFNSATGNFTTGACASGSESGGASTAGGSVAAAPTTIATYNFANGAKQGWSAATIGSSDSAVNIAGKDAYRLQGSNQYGLGQSVVTLPTGSQVKGKSYTLTAYIYANTTNQNATLSAGGSTDPFNTPTNTWTQISKTYTITGNGNYNFIALNISTSAYGNMDVAIADVKLVQNN